MATLFVLAALALSVLTGASDAAPLTHKGRPMPAASAPESAQSAELTRGFQALQRGELAEAEKVFSALLREQPRLASAALGLAEMELKRGRPSAAEAHLKAVLKREPNHVDALVAYSRFFSAQGRFELALEPLKKAVRIDANSYTAQSNLGDLMLNGLKKPDEAVTAYKAAVALQPSAVPPRFGLALAHLAAGRKAAALAQLEETAKLAPTDPALPHMIGRIHASEKRFAPAAAAMDRALALRADFMPALSDRADIHAEAGQDALAIADYEKLVTITPDNATLRLKQGMLYHRMGRLDDARNAYQAALQRNADLAVAYNNLAMISLLRKESPAQAKTWAIKAVELAPTVPQFHDTLGQAHRASGDSAKALTALEEAARLAPKDAQVLFNLGQAYEDLARRAEARAAYQRALAADARFAKAAQARDRIAALAP